MKKIVYRTLIIAICLVLIGIVLQFSYNEYVFSSYDSMYDQDYLGSTDKASIKEVWRLKDNYGEEIWPGLQNGAMPIILFNDRYEFLAGVSAESGEWNEVENDSIKGESYFRRPADNPQAFTTETAAGWAGSMSCLDYLNRDILLTIREKLPTPLNRLLPSQMIVRTNDFHVVAIIHERFHAWQAEQYYEKFNESVDKSSMVDHYPYEERDPSELFTQEGKYLHQALKAEDREKKLERVRKFLLIRQERREEMDTQYVDFEKYYEWLEGLAKYAEIKAYEVAYRHGDQLALSYKRGMPYWKTEWNNLEKLGEVNGSSRFYLSGMAQARLLDQLSDDWKNQIMKQGVFLETLLEQLAG
ncbi:MAG: hypothetical protein ACLFU6_09225 [Candidatus Hydrogenedentota bacterium]